MVTAHEVRKLAERLAKADALVQAGAVVPVAGLDGYAVVRNGDGTQLYLVRWEAGHEQCTCADFQHRQGKAQQPCKHILAAQVAAGTAQSPEYEINEINEKKETIARLKGRHSLALLNGEFEEVERLDKQLAAYGVAAS